jgi:hypothetical protein
MSDITKELKLCPFCGGKPEEYQENHGMGYGKYEIVGIRCSVCMVAVGGEVNENREESLEKNKEFWNTRYVLP